MAKAVVFPIKPPPEKSRRRRSDRVAMPPPPARAETGLTRKRLIEESRRWLSIINAHKLNDYKRRKVVADTIDNFRFYYNRGFLEYRKSVTEAGEYAAIEWAGKGSYFEDITGRRYVDCLGGYGIYSAGINHPKIVRAVKSQLERMPLSSQELLDPLRGALAELLGELAPGELQDCFFISNGTDAVEGAMKLARLYTGKPGFISCIGGFHGKSYGSLSLMGKGEYRSPFEPLLQELTT
jgi:putrescine aminotransferase